MKQTSTKTLALEWISRAEDDFAYAEAGERETERHHITCFLCQQIAEKTLKGLLVFKGENPPKTHNLEELLERALSSYPTLEAIYQRIRILDKYYIPTRYPGDHPELSSYTKLDASTALETAKNILDLAYQQLS